MRKYDDTQSCLFYNGNTLLVNTFSRETNVTESSFELQPVCLAIVFQLRHTSCLFTRDMHLLN